MPEEELGPIMIPIDPALEEAEGPKLNHPPPPPGRAAP